MRIKEELEVGRRFKKLVVVGDQQTWKYMDELEMEHLELFGWLLPMPGDWTHAAEFPTRLEEDVPACGA